VVSVVEGPRVGAPGDAMAIAGSLPQVGIRIRAAAEEPDPVESGLMRMLTWTTVLASWPGTPTLVRATRAAMEWAEQG